MLSHSLPATKEPVPKASPKDKPLPSPPIAQVDDSSITIEAKSLIDASDKPLIRRSPPEKSKPDEDWPVLHPEHRSSTGTLQEMLRESGSQLTQQAIAVEKERYPVLGNTVRQVDREDQLPVSRYSASYKTPHEPSSTPNIKSKAEESSIDSKDIRRSSDPFRDGIYDSGPVVPAKDLAPSPLKPSSGPAPVRKPVQDSKSVSEPRQTKTSSLRARLSAAQFDNDGPTKDASVTHSKSPDELVKGNRDSLLALKEAQGRRSTTPPVGKSVSKKASRDSIGSNRAPALFVGGSRRPAHPRRPSSRGSHRDEYRVPSPPLPPNRPAPAKPVSRGEDDKDDQDNNVDKGQAGPKVKPRKSSIPVPRMVVDRTALGGGKVATPERKDMRFGQARKEARDEIGGIYKEHTFADFVNELQATPPSATYNSLTSELLPNNHEPSVLEAIEESPQHTYQLKRLSVAAPKYGPTLKISSSAERYIMGDEEDRLLNKKKSKEFENRFKSKTSSSATPTSVTNKDTERPSSSQGLSHLSSRVGLIDPKVREKKAKSVDLGQVSPYRARTGSIQSTSDSRRQNPDSSVDVFKTSTKLSNDPFFDAPEEPLCGLEDGMVKPKAEDQCGNTIDEAAWISPLEKKPSRSSVSSVRDTLALDEYLPVHLQEHSIENMRGDDSSEDRKADMTQPPKDTSFQNLDTIVKDFAPQSAVSKIGPAKHAPSTPEINHDKHLHRSGHPPRSSSRTVPPNFSGPKTHKSSPLTSEKSRTSPAHRKSKVTKSTSSTAEKKPPTPPKSPPKEFHQRQNNLGSLQGFDSSRVEVDDPPSKYDLAKRDSITKRDSAAHDSHRSQSSMSMSMSKGVLSNFRGFFHKRSSNESLKSIKKSSKSKVSINANGSPFLPISEVHPIHRPTVASTARGRTTTPAANNTSSTPATTPSFTSPQPTEVSTSTTLAMQLLDAARIEGSSPKKERLLKLGQFMVDAITQARDAEKAMEEAKQASRKAEVANALCKRSLGEVERVVKGYRDEMVRGRGFL